MAKPDDRQVFDIYTEAMAKEPAQRASFLELACGDDAPLRKAVDGMLLAAHQSDPGLVDGVGNQRGAWLEGQTPQWGPGDRIGVYRLERLLGRGGMGVVFLAEREDGLSMKAALKLALGCGSPEQLIRFHREQEILASLEHPNIARLYDAGSAPGNFPYFVMEFVEGQPIDAYCRQNKLSFEGRLDLFHRVCGAVSYAHRSLVIHRDIKPANILVGTEGEPKLLDFGISGLMEPGSIEAKTQTVLGLTPAYASPEQLDNRRLTAASDIYSLGVLLFELLTDSLPFRGDEVSLMEFFRQIREDQIPKPSSVIGTDSEAFARSMGTHHQALRRRLLGDMDTIITHALAKSPEDRYPSVDAFATDIQRFLSQLPIEAREPTWGYRSRKFVTRHKWPLATALLMLTMLIGFSVTVAYQKQQTMVERNLARLERDTSQRVATFLADTFKGASPEVARGKQVTARDLLDQSAARIETELSDDPLIKAYLMGTMGSAYRALGHYPEARTLLEQALQIQQKTKGAKHVETAQALIELGSLYRDMGLLEKAELPLRQALEIRRPLADPTQMTLVLNALALLLSQQGNKDEAGVLLLEAYSFMDQVPKKNQAATVNNLGLLLKETGDYHGSQNYLQQALSLHRDLYKEPHPAIATSLNNLGLVHKEKGDLNGAETHWQAALAMRRDLYPTNHPKVLTSLNNLGALLKDKGDLNGAEPLFREVLASKRTQLGPDHPRLIISLNNLAVLLTDRAALAEADVFYAEALTIAEKKLKPDHLFGYILKRNLALLRLEQGKAQQALDLATVAVAGLKKKQKPGSLHLALAEAFLGAALLDTGQPQQAEALLLKSHAYLLDADRDFPLHNQRLCQWLTRLYRQTNRPAKAVAYSQTHGCQ